MVDRPPPSRLFVVERGGRLVVIDRETGQTPPTAAERMDAHDRNLGIEPIRPAKTPPKTSASPDMSAAARVESGLTARPAPVPKPAARPTAAHDRKERADVATTGRNKPWSRQPTDRSAPQAAPARIASNPPLAGGGARKSIVTSKWWDAKGPRTIELGPKGQTELTGGFMAVFFGLVIAAIIALFIEPLLLFVGAFVLFRFGGNLVGPVGARIVDKALAEKG